MASAWPTRALWLTRRVCHQNKHREMSYRRPAPVNEPAGHGAYLHAAARARRGKSGNVPAGENAPVRMPARCSGSMSPMFQNQNERRV